MYVCMSVHTGACALAHEGQRSISAVIQSSEALARRKDPLVWLSCLPTKLWDLPTRLLLSQHWHRKPAIVPLALRMGAGDQTQILTVA